MAINEIINTMCGTNYDPSKINEITKPENIEAAEEISSVVNTKDESGNKSNSIYIVYNLIILDESGSMAGVTGQTISGCNLTLNGIRSSAAEDKELLQFVSIYCFDTINSRYIIENTPIEKVRDLTSKDYCPNACTPLYDAIGNTVIKLMEIAANSYSIGKVTIITDGYENASQKWNHSSVVKLIENLKKKGWLFTFMGSNIDVEQTSHSLGIDSFMEFHKTDAGMREMFECECRSQRAYSKKMSFIRRRQFFAKASDDDRKQMLSLMNENYFTDDERIAPEFIQHLNLDDIFVFGSNVNGEHNGGAALHANLNFGAIIGQAEGIQGQSYAIPTVGNTFHEINNAIERFAEYVVLHPKQKFILTAIGCGNAGYTPEQIAPLFKQAYEFGNVYVPASFYPYVR